MYSRFYKILGMLLFGSVIFFTGFVIWQGKQMLFFPNKAVSNQVINSVYNKKLTEVVYSSTYDSVQKEIYYNTALSVLNNEKGKIYFRGDKNTKLIAITFDDGPDNKNTPLILDILKKYQVKATFFVIGKQIRNFPNAAKRIVEEGHEVGNHTYNHVILSKMTKEMVMDEVYKTDIEVVKVMGVKTHLLRPPFGIVTPAVVQATSALNYNIILWDADPDDWKSPPVTQIINYQINHASNGGIILLHSGEGQKLDATIRALPVVIDILRKKGYTFVTISQMFSYRETEK